MYVIIVYDIEQQRVAKVCKYLRRYLHWVQNSSFEGNISEAQLEKVKLGLRKVIDPEYDSVYIYCLPDEKYMRKEILGIAKAPADNILE